MNVFKHRWLLLILVLSFTTLNKAIAQDCSQLSNDLAPYSNKNRIFYSDMQSILELVKSIDVRACDTAELKIILEGIKEKRLETVKVYLNNKIKNEGSIDLTNEYNYLTGASAKFVYDFEAVFSLTTTKKPAASPLPQRIVNPPTQPRIPKEENQNRTCSTKIIQNDAVNLNNVRNQDSVGWCYAYAASDLLSFRFNKKVSAVGLYHGGGKSIEEDIVNGSKVGGNIDVSIKLSLFKRKGFCLEENLPSSDFKFCVDQRYYDFLNDFILRAREERFTYDLRADQCLNQNLKAAFPGINIDQVVTYARNNKQSKLIEYMHDLQCKVNFQNESSQLSVKSMIVGRLNRKELMNAINNQIDKGDLTGIGYYYNKISGESKTEGHGSVVVGRRINQSTGNCEYLVRNSWGKDCKLEETNEVSCHKNCTGDTCRQSGHFWVSENKLSEALIDVTYLQ